MFFSDPVAAFTNIRRALRPGGRLTFVCWQTPGANPWLSAPGRAALLSSNRFTQFRPVPRPKPRAPSGLN